MSVSTPVYLEVEHLGGPYDGQTHRVLADEDGNPPEFITVNDMTAIDWAVDPMSGPQSQIATQFYERDMSAAGGELRWVYAWKGETVTDAAA